MNDVKKWAHGLHIAGIRAAAESTYADSPDACLRRGLDLWNLNPDLFDQPDANRERETLATRKTWVALIAKYHGR